MIKKGNGCVELVWKGGTKTRYTMRVRDISRIYETLKRDATRIIFRDGHEMVADCSYDELSLIMLQEEGILNGKPEGPSGPTNSFDDEAVRGNDHSEIGKCDLAPPLQPPLTREHTRRFT